MACSAFRVLFAGLVAATLAAGCDIKVDDGKVSVGVSRGRASDQWDRSYPLPKGGRFELANQNGQIEVRGADAGPVTVKAFRQVSGRSDAEAEARLRAVEMKEDVGPARVAIEVQDGEKGGFSFGKRGLEIRWDVRLPPGLTVTLRTMNGVVRLENVQGTITAATTNGNVSGSGVVGAVDASSVNGSVSMDLDQVVGDVRLTTVNGSVRLQLPATADAELEAATVNGGVSVDDRLALADSTRDRGRFGAATSIRGRLNKGGPRLSLQTTNGGVRVSAANGVPAV
jgi:hypothetical protein